MRAGAALLLAAAYAVPAAAAEAAPARVVSMNLCTDELLVRLADRSQIASVTWLSTVSAGSNVADLVVGVRSAGPMGLSRPFDPELHARFQALLRRFGDPRLVAVKTAAAQGAPDDAAPATRHERVAARVGTLQRSFVA